MAAYQGKSVLLFSVPSFSSHPFCMEQRGDEREEGSWARRRISLGATDPIMRANHFSFCIRLRALPPPSSRGQPCLHLEPRALASKINIEVNTGQKANILQNHLSSSPSTCLTYWNYSKTKWKTATAERNSSMRLKIILGLGKTMSNGSIRRTCPHAHVKSN